MWLIKSKKAEFKNIMILTKKMLPKSTFNCTIYYILDDMVEGEEILLI